MRSGKKYREDTDLSKVHIQIEAVFTDKELKNLVRSSNAFQGELPMVVSPSSVSPLDNVNKSCVIVSHFGWREKS